MMMTKQLADQVQAHTQKKYTRGGGLHNIQMERA